MKNIPNEVISFLHNQSFVIVSTTDKDGTPHSACKGIVDITKKGRVYLLDLYLKQTYINLRRSPKINITTVDEHKFKGYCLKGKAKILKGKLPAHLLKAWDNRIASRITQRVLRNIHDEKGHPKHPEALLPKPEYIIVVEVNEIIDLTPQHLRASIV